MHRLNDTSTGAVGGFALALVAFVILPFAAGCDGSHANRSTRVQSAAAGAPTVAPRQRKMCLDPTGSSAPGFAVAVLNEISRQVLAAAANVPAQLDAAQPARPGLTLELRTVSTHSSATGGPYRRVTVAGVPALPAPPTADDPAFTVHAATWAQLESSWRGSATAARAQAKRASAAVRSFPLDRRASSGVLDCVAAFATTGAGSAGAPLLLATDLLDNASHGELVKRMDLAGAAVHLVLSCPAGSEADCPRRASAFARLAAQHHAGAVRVYRAEQLETAVAAWLGGAR